MILCGMISVKKNQQKENKSNSLFLSKYIRLYNLVSFNKNVESPYNISSKPRHSKNEGECC